jgi:hypothetical protein
MSRLAFLEPTKVFAPKAGILASISPPGRQQQQQQQQRKTISVSPIWNGALLLTQGLFNWIPSLELAGWLSSADERYGIFIALESISSSLMGLSCCD